MRDAAMYVWAFASMSLRFSDIAARNLSVHVYLNSQGCLSISLPVCMPVPEYLSLNLPVSLCAHPYMHLCRCVFAWAVDRRKILEADALLAARLQQEESAEQLAAATRWR